MTPLRKDLFSIVVFVAVVAAIPMFTKSGVILNFVMMALFACLIAQAWNCLLYTSPSPRDRQKSRMPSSA